MYGQELKYIRETYEFSRSFLANAIGITEKDIEVLEEKDTRINPVLEKKIMGSMASFLLKKINKSK